MNKEIIVVAIHVITEHVQIPKPASNVLVHPDIPVQHVKGLTIAITNTARIMERATTMITVISVNVTMDTLDKIAR